MAFTVNDLQDLLRLLDEHPEWLAHVRNRVLTAELLGLPAIVRELAVAQQLTEQRVRELAEAQRRTEQRLEELAAAQQQTEQRLEELAAAQQRTEQRLEELAAAQQRTEQRLEELAAAQQRTEQRLEELAAAQQRTEQRLEELAAAQAQTQGQLAALITRVGGITDSVDDLSTRTDVLTARVDTLRDQVGKLIGTDLEHRYRDRATSYFEPLAKRLRVLDRGRIADLLDDAVEAGQLTRTERNAVLAADLFLSGRRRDDQADVFLVVEISATIALSDVRRALERAALLARLGRPAMPVVAGESIRSDASGFAREHAVAQVLDGGVET